MIRYGLHAAGLLLALVLILPLAGCTAYRNTVPGSCVGNGFRESRSNKEPINFLRLRQEPPDAYRLDARDVLGIYIEDVLGNKDEPPPVHFPEKGEDVPPAIGFPMPIREDGSISLPLVEPIMLRGLTIPEAERRIRHAYLERRILLPGKDRIIVTLMRPRTYHVLVVREDETTDPNALFRLGVNPQNAALALALGQTRRGLSHSVELKAYENDVLHALSETGGLPGNDATNEVIILRGAFHNEQEQEYYASCMNDPQMQQQMMSHPNVIKIPLRVGPTDPIAQLTEEDIILNTGDIVFVRSRKTDVFYTGGLLPSGQWPLPRDYDIDVMQAISLAGGNVGSVAGAADQGLLMGGVMVPLFPPTRVIVVRPMCGEQVAIEIDLRRAAMDQSERIRIDPGDFILLEHRPLELLGNFLVGSFRFNYFLNN